MRPAQPFDVAVIKPHNPKDPCPNSDRLPGGRFVASCWPVKTMLQEAYDVLPTQITGGPPWIYTEPWDIVAQAEGFRGEIPLPQWRMMLRELIREHFKLSLRVDTKQLPGLVLVVARKGPRLTSNSGAPFQFDLRPGPMLICKKVTMAQLVSWLKGFTGAGRTVTDETGLPGEYDFTLQWTAQPLRGYPENQANPENQPTDVVEGPTIFTALQEQLGLRLESKKIPTQILVVDQAERPSEN